MAPKSFDGTQEDSPGPGFTELQFLGYETTGAGGQRADDRISYEVEETATEVAIVVRIQPRGGDQTCQGNPPTPVVVSLVEPLGNRRLVDGATNRTIRIRAR